MQLDRSHHSASYDGSLDVEPRQHEQDVGLRLRRMADQFNQHLSKRKLHHLPVNSEKVIDAFWKTIEKYSVASCLGLVLGTVAVYSWMLRRGPRLGISYVILDATNTSPLR